MELLASVIKAESNFHRETRSHEPERGLDAVDASTAHDLGVQDITRADQNIAGGTAYLDSCWKLYKDNLALALAAYNADQQESRSIYGIPPYRETRAYVSRVMNELLSPQDGTRKHDKRRLALRLL